MKNLVQPKTKMVNAPVQESKYFVAENNIVPLKVATPQLILELGDTKDVQVLEENKVQRIVRENKGKHILDKFFVKVSDYVDRVEEFLKSLIKLQLKSIEQKRIIYETERMDQFFKTRKSKKLVENKREADKKTKNKEINLATDKDTAMIIAGALGMGVGGALTSLLGGTQVYSDVVKEGEFAVQRGQNVSTPPAWIPFPKGTSGLVYTSGYGMRVSPTSGQYRMHSGIDIAGPVGAPIITPISGMVSSAGDEGDGYGYKVVITSGQVKMLFGHMHRQPPVSVGQQLQAGTVIGGLGNSGQSTGPHLHWNVYVNGNTVNPVDWTRSNPPQVGTAGSKTDLSRRPLDQESEGGININKRIMVGEAGVEFIIPMSQMPLFIQAMMEEKIKTLNPFYEVSEGFESNLKSSSGSAKTTFASGGIAGGSPEFWQMVAISATEDVFHPQGQADVAQSIYNRIAVGSYPGGRNITKIIVADGQYQPTFKNPGDWSVIRDRKTAINAAKILPYVGKKAPQLIDSAAKAITNPALQKEAARFIGGRTDFMGESQKGSMKPEDITRGKNHNYFGWFYDARLPKAAPIHPSVKSMTKSTNAPSKPKPKPKDENIFDRIKNFFLPSPKKKMANMIEVPTEQEEVAYSPSPISTTSLMDIPDNVQQEIAYDTQSKFEMFAEPENSIVIVRVPVIIDKTTAGIKVVG